MSAASQSGEEISINWLCKLLLKEIETSDLQSLSPDVFQKLAASISHLRRQGVEGIEGIIRDRIVELLSQSSRILVQTRLQKIVSSSDSLDYSRLTDEEKYILHGRRESERRVDEVVAAVKAGRVKLLESMCAKARSNKVIVRFVEPMDQFVGIDMTKYGPYLKEDVASLPFENARSFIGRGVATEIRTGIP